MAKHIGIVACSAEGAALCYRTLCAEAPARMGEHAHPEITLHTHPLAEYMVHIRVGDWDAVADLMASSARKLAGAGADFAVCPDNTIHEAYDRAVERSPIPWLHIADAVLNEAERRGWSALGVTGTQYLMEGPVYAEAAERRGIEVVLPEPADREQINAIIFKELVNAVFTDRSRAFFYEVFGRLRDRGAEAVVLGCTEIPLLVRPEESPLPALDSTRLLARAALDKALAG
jgi:aspartate racemase